MIKIKARIYLFKHEGRKTPFSSGYRPAIGFKKSKDFFTGHIDILENDKFLPGSIGEVTITFNNKNLVDTFLIKGNTFSINEPPVQIGEGEIIEILE